MAASDAEDIKPTKMKKRKVKTDTKQPKLAILFDVELLVSIFDYI